MLVKAFRLGLMDLDPPWMVSETAEKPQRAQPIIELKIGCMLGAFIFSGPELSLFTFF